MDGTTLGRLLVAGAVALAAATGCTQIVPGTPVAATGGPRPAAAAPDAAPEPAPEPAPPPDPAAAAPGPPRSSLASDVLADECLLDAAQLAALVGRPVAAPGPGPAGRPGGPAGTSCVARATPGGPALAAVNVYLPREGTPAEFVLAAPPADRRDLTGVGAAAVLLGTPAGPTLQLAGARHVVTIAVFEGAPSDDAWRAAARAALGGLR